MNSLNIMCVCVCVCECVSVSVCVRALANSAKATKFTSSNGKSDDKITNEA